MKIITALLVLATAVAAGDSREDIDRKLETKVSLHLRGARLNDAIDVLRSATGLNFVVAEGADREVSIVVTDLSAKSVLGLLLRPRELTAVFENGAVVIRNQKCLAGGAVLRVYDVRAAMMKIRDFPGARLELNGPGASFGIG